ncbi:golgin subfamily B member 1 isoform X2 [Labrus mixtus]|uniref:golgin subfamily B member 1 isoform X2 n=1 Tax=Labrus mixtus TaxID=508554 RepID=UPI0029C07BC8|nr:golgin subfamily B member 1 isoform X2 [Labrus mixtus]
MDQPEEELQQISIWLSEEGITPVSPKEVQLCVLWRALQHTKCHLSGVTWDLDKQRSQHSAELTEVRKSLEQIRIFTEHKDVLAQEIQDENDQLKDQLRRLISLQDAQISEVAKMLYQQGLTELIHSSPSEQVAYLLVERASLLETSEVPDHLKGHGGTEGTKDQAEQQSTNTHQAEARCLASQTSSVQRECSRLERDLEEGSRRLAMAHNEIRRLTDELESAHLTLRAYEPELQAAQQEVEQLRQEVENLKKYEMVELRKTKELNDRLDLEIRALRGRVRTLDAEKNTLQQKSQAAERAPLKHSCRSLQEEADAQTRRLMEKEETVISLQRGVEQLESALQEHQQQAEQKLLTVQAQAIQANKLAQSQATDLIQSNEICKDLQNKLSAQSRCLLEKESEIQTLKQQLDDSHKEMDNIIAAISTEEKHLQDNRLMKQEVANIHHDENPHTRLEDSFSTKDKGRQRLILLLQNKENTKHKDFPGFQEAVKTLVATQDECERLRKEICETLKCLDKERRKYHEMKEKQKTKLLQAKQKLDEETAWRDERISNLGRELSLCSHSLAKEKELIINITVENDKLLVERRRLLQQLNEEEHNKKDCHLKASLSKCRVDFLEMENKKLGNKILHMSNQLIALERSLQILKSPRLTEELKKRCNSMHVIKSLHLETSRVMTPEPSEVQGLFENTQSKQPDRTSSPRCVLSGPLSRSSEMGYLNLTSTQSLSEHLIPSASLSSSDSTCS